MDIRRTPQAEERNFIDWLHMYHIPVIPVLTKADKLSKNKQNKQLQLISAALEINREALTLFSAKSRLGKDQVWSRIEALVAPAAIADEGDTPHE
jgi:GTP-binding protein